MNIASWFTAYQLLAAELEREREAHAETKRQAEEKERSLIDAIARTAGKPPVFERPEPVKQTPSRPAVFGPTMSARAQAEREKEEAQKREVVVPSNGHRVEAPEIPSE